MPTQYLRSARVEIDSIDARLSAQQILIPHMLSFGLWCQRVPCRVFLYYLSVCLVFLRQNLSNSKGDPIRIWGIPRVAGQDLGGAQLHCDLLFKDKLMIVFHLHLNPP